MKNVEIYELSKNLERMTNVELDDSKIQVTVNLEIPLAEAKKLEDAKLVSPIREAFHFKKIKQMKYAMECLEKCDVSEEEKIELENIVTEGRKAVDYLMEAFRLSAFNFGKNWMHEDRINTWADWQQIIYQAEYEAILNYDLDKQVQFNTFLKNQIMCACKENKCSSTLLAVNASAMHKARMIEKAQEELKSQGLDPYDLDLLAAKIGRDISCPNKRKNFERVLKDIENIHAQKVSTDYKASEDSRTVGESLESDQLSPYEVAVCQELKKEFIDFYNKLDKDAQLFLQDNLFKKKKVTENYSKTKALKQLQTPKLKEMLTEMNKYQGYPFFDMF